MLHACIPRAALLRGACARAVAGTKRIATRALPAPAPPSHRTHRVLSVRCTREDDERSPVKPYMAALEEEIGQRPDALPSLPRPSDAVGGGDAATWHSALTVGQVMTTDVLVLSDKMPLLHAMRALLARHVSGAPVVDEQGELVGVLSQSDVLRRCAASPRDNTAAPPAWLPMWHALMHRGPHGETDVPANEDATTATDPAWLLEVPVCDAMSTEVVITQPGALLADAAALMTHHGVNRLPVLDHGRLVGVLARGDVLTPIARGDNAQATTQPAAADAEPPHRDL